VLHPEIVKKITIKPLLGGSRSSTWHQ